MIQFKANYSRRVLLQLVILSAIIRLLMLINLEFITNIYFKNQATNTGFIVNGSILILFALGLVTVSTRRNAVGILMGVELVLNAASINFIAFSRSLRPQE